jgi:hypothetical protein
VWKICISIVLAAIVVVATPVSAAPPALIEVQVQGETLQGQVCAHTDRFFWLQSQDGRLRALQTDEVHKFRKISPQFASWTGSVVRDNLRREFGKGFEFAGTRHYVVGAPSSQKARLYAETFEELFRTFQMYFSVRGFTISEPEFPLIAIVFPDIDSFARYATAEKVDSPRSFLGYYMRLSNRIALYETPESAAQQSQLLPTRDLPFGSFGPFADSGLAVATGDTPWTFGEAWGTFQGSLKDTMIHEATHQAAFNTGLHTRIGDNPKWVVEGLATVFEAPGIRNSGGSGPARTRINHGRFINFGDFRKSRLKPNSLESFLSNDELFKTSMPDFYSEAWALSFFLIETRPRAYAEYLRTIAARDPLQAYPGEDRVADFKNKISKELPLLEAEFLRFIAGIK